MRADRFERLFRTYYADLCNFVLSIVGSGAAAEDIVQEAFAQLWERSDDWQPHTSAKAYLYRAVRNNALSACKRHDVARRREIDLSGLREEDTLPEHAICHSELVDAIREAVERMPERQREVFRLSRNGGFTYREIASALDISVSTVETHMVRALRFLREALQVHL